MERTQWGLDAANEHKAQVQQDLEVTKSKLLETEQQAQRIMKKHCRLTTQLDAEKIRSQSLGKALEDADCNRNTLTAKADRESESEDTLTAKVKEIEGTVANLTRQQQALSATEIRLQRQRNDAARSMEQQQHEIAHLRVNTVLSPSLADAVAGPSKTFSESQAALRLHLKLSAITKMRSRRKKKYAEWKRLHSTEYSRR